MELAGKVALVTGAARGLGRAMALARAGVDVAVSDVARPADGAIPYDLASGDDLGEAAPVAAMDEAQWDRIFAVNVKGVFLCARAAIPRGGAASSLLPRLAALGRVRTRGEPKPGGV